MRTTTLLLRSLAALTLSFALPAQAAEMQRASRAHGLFTADNSAHAGPTADTSVKNGQPEAPPASSDLALRKKIGQMILIGFPGTEPGEEWPDRIRKMIGDGTIGGVVLFAQNIVDPVQLKRLTGSLERKDLPPFICVDQEGGSIQRLTAAKGFIGLPSAEAVATLDPASAARIYRGSAQELVKVGINCNLGPVLDLNVDPNAAAIGRLGRSYGSDPKTVIEYARIFIDANRDAGVLTAAKHFPGHGSARLDSHEQIVDITHTWREAELEPFQAIIDDGRVNMIMMGHLILKEQRFSDGDKPASLSPKAIQEELRTHYGFRGLVVSDDLDMGAIHSRYGVEDAAAMAVEAGSDLIIVSNSRTPDPEIARRIISKILIAIDQGRITRENIEQSYSRIMQMKRRFTDRRSFVMH